MLNLLYDLFLLFWALCSLPKGLWERKFRRAFSRRLGIGLPYVEKKEPIWIHSVSLGETKAVLPLVQEIMRTHPQTIFIFSSTTETGLAEGKKLFPSFATHFLLPFDFSWTMRRLMKRISPHMTILVEGDLWYNLIRFSNRCFLVNGKISEKSKRRFLWIPFFTKRLLSHIDVLCVQNQTYASRFLALSAPPEKVAVCGNLKLDQPLPSIDEKMWREKLQLKSDDRVITLASTHAPEEEELLIPLLPLLSSFPKLKILIVPRHPERFSAVAKLLTQRNIPFFQFSSPSRKEEQVGLIDTMGVLQGCYQLSELAIVGGSFGSLVGGHNIFEPAILGVPVLFGPHMETQPDLVSLILENGAGKQISLEELPSLISSYLSHPPVAMREAGIRLREKTAGAARKTWNEIVKSVKI